MLKVNINGLDFKNPVIAASGTFGFGAEYNNFYDVGILGGISSKGLTLNEKAGNDGIRVFEPLPAPVQRRPAILPVRRSR